MRLLGVWAGGGLVANYAWEMLQMDLYEGLGGGMGWWPCFVAALGDLVILSLLYGAMALAARDWLWFARLSRGRIALLAGLGFLAALAIEGHALAVGKWTYQPAMPRVPVLGIAWVPVLQMVSIPLALAWLSSRWVRRVPATPERTRSSRL